MMLDDAVARLARNSKLHDPNPHQPSAFQRHFEARGACDFSSHHIELKYPHLHLASWRVIVKPNLTRLLRRLLHPNQKPAAASSSGRGKMAIVTEIVTATTVVNHTTEIVATDIVTEMLTGTETHTETEMEELEIETETIIEIRIG